VPPSTQLDTRRAQHLAPPSYFAAQKKKALTANSMVSVYWDVDLVFYLVQNFEEVVEPLNY
jgi:hypothetical protein